MSETPISVTEMKPWCIMCCGCSRLLAVDRVTMVPRASNIQLSQVACFETHAAADEAAAAAGWSVADTDGSNHRCPECIKEEASVSEEASVNRRGAFVHVRDLVS